MSDTLFALAEAVDALRAQTRPRAAFDAFAQAMAGHGFTHVFAGRLSLAALHDLSPDPFIFFNFDAEDLPRYLREGQFANDPVLARARLSNRPFRWREVHGDMTPQQAETVAAFAAAGLTHGLTVPIDRVRGVTGVVTLGRGSDFALDTAALIEIEMLSRGLFETCDALFDTPSQNPVQLTQRERDVLSLVAQGKTNWEAGQILGVSEYSVRDYLRALADRLQTSNRTHTVVRAIQLGLIGV